MDGTVQGTRRGERRTRLLDAASRVFSRRSYAQASMDEIAHEAGVGKPTLYRYFESKDALFSAVFVEALDAVDARLDAVLASESGVEARLRGLVRALIPTFRDHLVSLRTPGEDAAALDRSNRRIFRERRARIVGALARALRDGVDAGEIRLSADPERVGHLVVGMIWSGTAAIRVGDDALARDIVGLVLDGVGQPNASGEAVPGRLAKGADRPASVLRDAGSIDHDDVPTGLSRCCEAASP